MSNKSEISILTETTLAEAYMVLQRLDEIKVSSGSNQEDIVQRLLDKHEGNERAALCELAENAATLHKSLTYAILIAETAAENSERAEDLSQRSYAILETFKSIIPHLEEIPAARDAIEKISKILRQGI